MIRKSLAPISTSLLYFCFKLPTVIYYFVFEFIHIIHIDLYFNRDVLRAIPERLTLKRKVKAELLRRSSLQISCVLNFSQQIQRLSYRQYVRFNIGIAITKVTFWKT